MFTLGKCGKKVEVLTSSMILFGMRYSRSKKKKNLHTTDGLITLGQDLQIFFLFGL
jgi:hypothetical protein